MKLRVGDLMNQFHQKPTTHLGVITLEVVSLEKMTKYYETVLGLTTLEESSDAVLLGVSNKPLIKLYNNKNTIKAYERQSGLYHLAILLPTMKDFASYLLYLNDLKLIEGLSDHGVSNAVYFTDIEGNGIEVYADNEPQLWPRKNGQIEMVTEQVDVEKLMKLNPRPFTKLPEETVLGHIHLHVSNLEEAKAFYVGLLGLDLIQAYGNQALFLSFGGYHHHIGLNTWLGTNVKNRQNNQSGIKSYRLIFNDEETRSNVVKRLVASNYNVDQSTSVYQVTDPFGLTIQLAL